jgi:hypothetical protein
MFRLLLLENRSRQLYPLAPIPNARPQKQSAQMLLDGARADLQLRRDLFIAAALNQKLKNFLVAGRDFDLVHVHHDLPRIPSATCNSFAKYSLSS